VNPPRGTLDLDQAYKAWAVGNAGVMGLNDLWFVLSLVWLFAIAGGLLFAIFV
jgi:hypothetical protein